MEMDEKSLDKISGGFKTVELKDGSFAIVADSAELYNSAEEAQKAITELEKKYQFGGFGLNHIPGNHKGHNGFHHGPHHGPHPGPCQGHSENGHSEMGQFPNMD